MANKDLRFSAHHKKNVFNWWWYEEGQGIAIIYKCSCNKSVVIDIPWNSLKKALARKEKK